VRCKGRTEGFQSLRAFRGDLYGCFRRRADALFEVADALLASVAVPSLPHLGLRAVHWRGWGSAYAAQAAGEVEEGFYVLEDELELIVGTEKIAAPAGTFVMVQIGVPHSFGNAWSERVRFLATMPPDFYVRYFEELSLLIATGRPDPKAVGQIMARYATDAIPSRAPTQGSLRPDSPVAWSAC
jgi:hypothetical protein